MSSNKKLVIRNIASISNEHFFEDLQKIFSDHITDEEIIEWEREIKDFVSQSTSERHTEGNVYKTLEKQTHYMFLLDVWDKKLDRINIMMAEGQIIIMESSMEKGEVASSTKITFHKQLQLPDDCLHGLTHVALAADGFLIIVIPKQTRSCQTSETSKKAVDETADSLPVCKSPVLSERGSSSQYSEKCSAEQEESQNILEDTNNTFTETELGNTEENNGTRVSDIFHQLNDTAEEEISVSINHTKSQKTEMIVEENNSEESSDMRIQDDLYFEEDQKHVLTVIRDGLLVDELSLTGDKKVDLLSSWRAKLEGQNGNHKALTAFKDEDNIKV
ncbi:hypothetical protein SK128_020023 [Halocaridina rubra]|uniref:SHSP domain-containing protein n=1 Tax=Halocaridina rubra TaxID=373956 RepID=A0AAN8WQN3_HALRR